jgi:hypothetical protein
VIAFDIILAASPALLLGTVAFLILIVIGIRRTDRGDLASPPRSRADAIIRRVTGLGVRADRRSGAEGNDQCTRLTAAVTSCP